MTVAGTRRSPSISLARFHGFSDREPIAQNKNSRAAVHQCDGLASVILTRYFRLAGPRFATR